MLNSHRYTWLVRTLDTVVGFTGAVVSIIEPVGLRRVIHAVRTRVVSGLWELDA